MSQSKYTKELLEPLIKENRSYEEILTKLNYEITSYSIDYLRRTIKEFNLNATHLRKTGKYTKELLEPLVKTSVSIAEVLRKLNVKNSGGMHKYIKKLIEVFNISMNHFTGQSWNKGNTFKKGRNIDDILLKIPNSTNKERTSTLRKCLFEIGRLSICELCGLGNEWNGKPINLQIDHINGDNLDNNRENLRFVCPNCHSQTENYCRNNIESKIKIKCKTCYNILTTKTKYDICKACYDNNINNVRNNPRPSTYKVPHPSKEELESLMKIHNWTKLGEMFGVTDNAVKKWAKSYGIEFKTKKYNKKPALQTV